MAHNYCVTLYNRSQETSQRGKKNIVASYVSYISHAFRGILSRLPPQDSDAVGVRNNRPRRRIWRLGGMLRNRWTTKHSYSVSVWRQNVLALPRTKPLAVIIPCCQLVLLHPDTSTALSWGSSVFLFKPQRRPDRLTPAPYLLPRLDRRHHKGSLKQLPDDSASDHLQLTHGTFFSVSTPGEAGGGIPPLKYPTQEWIRATWWSSSQIEFCFKLKHLASWMEICFSCPKHSWPHMSWPSASTPVADTALVCPLCLSAESK